MNTEEKCFVVDDFVTTKSGQPYRLLKFGPLVKGGVKRVITRELAEKFRLPHFKAPVKLGSHADETPAGGHLIDLLVMDDGLYGVPEWTPRGEQSLANGDYRYHSPEILWSGGLEDPKTGDLIPAPMIVGDALLHTPHMGEDAALYVAEYVSEEVSGMDEHEQQQMNLLERFTAALERLFPKPAPEPEQAPDPVEPEAPAVDNFAAVAAERDQFKAELDRLQAEQAKRERVERYAAELRETKADPADADKLAGMTDELAEWVVQRFRALSAQINESALTTPLGSEGEGSEAQTPHERVTAYAAEHKISYPEAVSALARTEPDLFK